MCLPPGMFERPPNGTIVQINAANEKTRLTAKGQPRLFACRIIKDNVEPCCRSPPFPSFASFSQMTKRR